jgi:hypothetical protein
MYWAGTMKRFGLILVAMLGLAVSAAPASAHLQFTLNCTSVACTGVNSGNWGTVTLNQTVVSGVTHVAVSVSLASGFEFGDNGQNVFLWNGTGDSDNLTIASLAGNASSFAAQGSPVGANGTYTPPSPFNATGAFDYAINRTNNSGDPTTLSFDVTKSGNLSIMISNFLTGNDGGGYFFGARLQATGNNTNQDFFVVATGPGVQIPEPATWLLFFAALAGLTVLYRRRKLARA